MTEPLVDRAEVDAAFQALAQRLHVQGLHGELYVFGGTSMVYLGARDATHDVDSRIDRAHGALIEAAHAIADERGWPRSWMNEQGTPYLPSTRDARPSVVFSAPGLVVRSASPEVLLAMKASSLRKVDLRDVVFLAEYLGLRSAQEIVAIHDRWYPGQPLSDDHCAQLDDVEAILTTRSSRAIPDLAPLLRRASALRMRRDTPDGGPTLGR